MEPFPQPPHEEVSALERFYDQKSLPRRVLGGVGLQAKLTFAFAVLIAVTLSSYALVAFESTRQKFKANLADQAQQAASTLSALAAETPGGPAGGVFEGVMERFTRSARNIVFVSRVGPDGRTAVTHTPTGRFDGPVPEAGEVPGAAVYGENAAFGSFVSVGATLPPETNGTAAGTIRVGVSMRPYIDSMAQRIDQACRVGGTLVLLAVPAAWLVVRRMFKPIRQLVGATQRIAAGEMNTRVAVGRRDSIGDLARAFNHMVLTITHQQAALKLANHKLHEANRDLEEKIDQRTAQLETANKRLSVEIAEKEDFLRAISHDLNAPLRNINGMVTMLQTKKRDQLDDDARHRLERIKKNVDVETDLINELLELSRIKTRRGQMEMINLEEMVWDLRGVFENDLRTKDIQLVVDSVLPALHAERPRIRQVFQNLIDNAIKYMGDGYTREIHVGCVLRNSEAEFYVRDTGKGIEPEDVGKVFFVFRRGKDAGTQAVAGKGIGLASVKSIVETYSGKIWVESVLGTGTTFRFTINGQHLPQLGGRTVLRGEEGEPLAA